ncbi:MAG: hypothetical protein AB8F95_06905 [Bacteroidia bacterium]
MKYILTIFALTAIMFSACSDKLAEEVKKLDTEVIAVHDEVMPKMTEIAKLQKKMKGRIDNLVSQGEMTDSLTKELSISKEALTKLETAEKSMNDWMMKYHEVSSQKVDSKTMLEALKAEKDKVTVVKDQILSSLKEARKIFPNE